MKIRSLERASAGLKVGDKRSDGRTADLCLALSYQTDGVAAIACPPIFE